MVIVYGIFCLSIIIFVHELGHHLSAKMFGIEVLRFSIGMGKRLFGFTFKGTDYCISLLPIGGYCKMKGEDSFLQAFGKGESSVKAEPGSFYAAHPLKRILVAFSGPLFNIIFSVVALSVVWGIGFSYEVSSPRLLLSSEYPELGAQDDLPQPHPADSGGLRSGDLVLAIDGKKIQNYSDIQDIVFQNPEKRLEFLVEREGSQTTLFIVPALDKKRAIGRIGVYPMDDAVIGSLVPAGPAARAGLVVGDKLTALNGEPIRAEMDIQRSLQSKSATVELEILRGDKTLKLSLAPDYQTQGEAANPLGIFIKRNSYRSPRRGFFGTIAKASVETWKNLSLTVKSIGLLFRKVDLSQALAGPARITYMIGSVAESSFSSGFGNGLTTVFNYLSIFSVSLFLMNLLPIPILDGGMIVIILLEMIRKRPFKPVTIYRITIFGFFIIISIFLFATFNDILFFTLKK